MTARSPAKRPRIGIYSFSCCEGCQVMFFQLERKLLSIFELVDFANSRLLGVNSKVPDLDVAIVEGSITGRNAEAKLKRIRKRSKYLIALGACATTGGIPAMLNAVPKKLFRRLSAEYGARAVRSVPDTVKVDYRMQGCPVSERELLNVLLKLANGIEPRMPCAPVCAECMMRETYCLLIKGKPCFGPIALAGCNAPCPAEGFYCNACRGIYSDGHKKALFETLLSQGLSKKEIQDMLKIYNSPTKGAPHA